jgi:hypothetical protein
MKLIRKVGSTSQILQVFIQDSSSTAGAGLTGLVHNSAGLAAYYHRDTDTTATAITLVTMTVGTFTSSGFKEIDATNMPGWYQFCPPNAAMATGASSVGLHLKGATNMAPLPIEVDLAATSAAQAAAVWDEVNTGVTHNVANSTGRQLRTLAINTGVIYTGTAPSQAGMTSTQIKLDGGASAVDNIYQWNVISITGGTDAGDSAIITAYNGTTKVATVNTAWSVQPDATSVFQITPTAQVQVVSYITGQDPATLVLEATAATRNTAGTIGEKINDISAISVPANFSAMAITAAGGVTLADGVAHGGTPGSGTATFAMQSVNVTNPSGTAFLARSTGGGGRGLDVRGNAGGAGFVAQGGDSGHGFHAEGGGTSGDGMRAFATGIGVGFTVIGSLGNGLAVFGDTDNAAVLLMSYGTGPGVDINAVDTGPGVNIQAAGGHGIAIAAAASGKHGIISTGGTDGDGFHGVGTGTGVGFTSTPDAVGFGSGGGLDAEGVRDAIGLATANLDDQLATLPTALEVAAEVWDLATSGHTDVGSFGEAVMASASAGDPWITPIPAAYPAGTAGYVLGTSLSAAGIRSAIGLTSANLDDQFADIPTAAENADKLLGRSVEGGSDAGRTVREAFYFLRNKWTITGGVLTVYAANDSTVSWTATVNQSSANPVIGIDPA